MVLLGVPDKASLEETMTKIDLKGICYSAFHEIYDDMGLTAIATENITGSARNVFRGMKLWSCIS